MYVHWPTGVITVYKTDSFMAFAGGNVYNMDTNGFRLALKDAEDDPIGMPFPDTHRHNTTVLLGGIEYARILEILAPYTVTFDDTGGPWVCNLIGSNNNILDRANLTTVQIRSNNSAGLTQMQEIQYSSFENGVTVDVINGTSGTVYPSGTRRKPVNNLADAMVIANLYGFGTIYVIGDMVIDSGGNYSGMSFVGESKNKTTLTVSAESNVYKCEFYEAHVTGVLDGDSVLRDCLVDNLNYVSGFVERCVLAPGVIILGGSTTAHFLDCYSGVPGMGTPIIDMGGNGPPLALRNYNGGIELTNKSGNSSVSIDLNSGQVILSNTVTAGTVVVRGMGKLTNNSQGAIINRENLLDVPVLIIDTAEEVFNTQLGTSRPAGSFGEFLVKKVLTVAKFIGLK